MINKDKDLRPLILDTGSSTFRLGWAGDDFPKIIEPSVYVEISDYLFKSDIIDGLEDIFIKDTEEEHLFGTDALKYKNILKIHEFKKEDNYIVLFKFFNHYYKKLDIPPKYHYKQPLIIITPFYMSEMFKNKLQQVFFDEYNFPMINFLPESQAILSTLGKTSGTVINMGESNTYISTVVHGFTNIMARDVFPIAGKELTESFLNMALTEKSLGRNIYLDNIQVKAIKENASICISDPKDIKKVIKSIKEGSKKYNHIVNFPDDSSLEINLERFLLSEPFFNPKLIHIDYIPLDAAISKVIKTWDRESWIELISNIILSGGTSLIPGLKERLKKEMLKHFPKIKDRVNVIAVAGRENMSWIGASILYSKNQLQTGWIQNSKFKTNNEQLNEDIQ